jgi:hypothetical protein
VGIGGFDSRPPRPKKEFKMNEVIARLDYQAVLIIEFLMYLFFGVGLSFVVITIYRLLKDWVRGR